MLPEKYSRQQRIRSINEFDPSTFYDRCKLIEDRFKDKIDQKETFDRSDLSSLVELGFNSEEHLAIFTQLSAELSSDKEKEAIFISKLAFTLQECNNIFLKGLIQFPDLRY